MLHDNTGGQAGRGSGRGSERDRELRGQAGRGQLEGKLARPPETSTTLHRSKKFCDVYWLTKLQSFVFSKVKSYGGSIKKLLFKFGSFSNTIPTSFGIKLLLLSKKP